jgi:hypothetical protein
MTKLNQLDVSIVLKVK